MRLVVLPPAAEDTRCAVSWLEDVKNGLGHEFLEELAKLCYRLTQHPGMYQAVRGEARRAVLPRFDYAVVYRVKGDTIEVIGVLHCRLSPARVTARFEAAG